jgi:hypothetical protein
MVVSGEMVVAAITVCGSVVVSIITHGIKKSNNVTNSTITDAIAKLSATTAEMKVTEDLHAKAIADLKTDVVFLKSLVTTLLAKVETLTSEIRKVNITKENPLT